MPVPKPGNATDVTASETGFPAIAPDEITPWRMSNRTARAAKYGLTVSARIIGTRMVGAAIRNGMQRLPVGTMSAVPTSNSP